MNTYYESFLRRDIFPEQPSVVDELLNIYDQNEKERRYINLVIEDFIHGCNAMTTKKRIMSNVIYPYRRQYECMGKYLDDEYENKMKGGE